MNIVTYSASDVPGPALTGQVKDFAEAHRIMTICTGSPHIYLTNAVIAYIATSSSSGREVISGEGGKEDEEEGCET